LRGFLAHFCAHVNFYHALCTRALNSLKDIGFTRFLEGSDGQVALELINAGQKVDVIPTDPYLPRVSGIDLRVELQSKLSAAYSRLTSADT